jgi:hypothetical protein
VLQEVICIDDSSDDEEGSAPALQSQSGVCVCARVRVCVCVFVCACL